MRQFLLGCTLFAFASVAMAVSLHGRLTPADLMRRDFTNVLISRHELARSIAQTNEEFIAARRELESTAPGTPAHAKAQEKLRNLELSKDLGMLLVYLRRGGGQGDGQRAAQDTEIAELSGDLGVVDAIPKDARPAFESWARSVQSALGTGEGKPLLLNDNPESRERFIDALQQSTEAYEDYLEALQKARR